MKIYLHRPIEILSFLCTDIFLKSYIVAKYFSIFNNTPPLSWVAHIGRDFLTCYSCSHFSSMILCIFLCGHYFVQFGPAFCTYSFGKLVLLVFQCFFIFPSDFIVCKVGDTLRHVCANIFKKGFVGLFQKRFSSISEIQF